MTTTATAAPERAAGIWLGQTGLRVSRIGLGLAALGRPAYMAQGRDADLGGDRSVDAMRRRCYAVLDTACAAGVRYIDTARSYGLAEQFLSAWWNHRELPNRAITVGSKWGYVYTGRWQLDPPFHEVRQLSVETLRRQAQESWTILGKRLALYQIHSATLDSGVLDDGDVLAELVQLRQRGMCIGLTVTGPRQADTIRRALEVRVDGVQLFQTVQATWNLLEPSAGSALADASAEGWGVIVKEVLANGRLTDRFGHARLRDLRAHAGAVGATVETIVAAATLAQPWADVVLSGAVTRDQLRAHVAALDITVDRNRFAALAEPAWEYWRQRSLLPWK
jgi:aryl-alcohol dehydrogenase-like predicted oxidoreductase